MKVNRLAAIIDSDFYVGVPDSQLRALCDYLMDTYGIDKNHHMIVANEGNAVAVAAGYHLATGNIPVVYLQNSGEGNIINPVASLLNPKVYAIPQIFVIGWRGEPGVYDEPQHIYQGEVTLKLLEDMGIEYVVIRKETEEEELMRIMNIFRHCLNCGQSVALVIAKGALTYEKSIVYGNNNTLTREDAIECIAKVADEDVIISTTGKASRELFEIRERNNVSHQYDFLTVGSMGHCSSIALGVALGKPNKKVWCIDGDGAALMHMGAMPVIGAQAQSNMVHIIINNSAHETVGGMPTVATNIDWKMAAKSFGYKFVYSVSSLVELEEVLYNVKKVNELTFIEIKCKCSSRSDLGRPTTKAIDNKKEFMNWLNDNQ